MRGRVFEQCGAGLCEVSRYCVSGARGRGLNVVVCGAGRWGRRGGRRTGE